MIGFFVTLIWLILSKVHLTKAVFTPLPKSLETMTTHSDDFLSLLNKPFAIFLVQIITILLVARLFSWLAIKIRQPSVIGEIVAGIVLGPSLIGLFFPEVYSFIFPPSSISNLNFLSQIGLILFMFIVGMELDMQILLILFSLKK